VALIFALVPTPIALLVFGSIDFYRANGIRGNLQDALDAAALAAARAPTTDPAEIDRIGRAALMAALANHSNMQPPTASFRLLNGRVVVQASAEVTPWVAQLFLPDGMTVSADSEGCAGRHAARDRHGARRHRLDARDQRRRQQTAAPAHGGREHGRTSSGFR